MMTRQFSRRALLAGLAGIATSATVSCSGSTKGDASAPLRVTSWGDPTKIKLRGKVVAKFQQTHPDIKMKFEGSPVVGYFDKLATQISSGSPPDIINMDSPHMAQYSKSGVLAALDEYKGSTIHVETLDDLLLAQGVFENKLYGVPFALSTYSLGYNQTLFDELGLSLPDAWTYEDYADFAVHIHQVAGPKVYGSEDMSGDLASFELWLRAQGTRLYDGDRKLGFDESVLGEWFKYWADLRGNGGITPADVAAQYTYDDATGGPIAARKCALTHIFTNNFTGSFQALTKDTLKLTTPPVNSDGKHGAFPTPSSVMTVSSQCQDKKSAAIFIDWFVNSPESAKILRFISGPTASTPALKVLESDKSVTAAESEIIRYTTEANKNALPAPPIKPAGDSEIGDLLLRTSQDLAFGRTNLSAAAKKVVDDASQILATTS